VLFAPITMINTFLSDPHYNDNLMYHYTGGCALAALKNWSEPEEFFEICMSSPSVVPSAI
jgi:COP9 signalosome complex subunit 3